MNKKWRMPDALWERLEKLLPAYPVSHLGGRPRVDLREIADGIFYVLRTGCQWKAVPEIFGSGSTLHRYFQEWNELAIFEELWRETLQDYDELKGIQWKWQAVDGTTTKAPLGGEKNRPQPYGSRKNRHQTQSAHGW
jgi:transposase